MSFQITTAMVEQYSANVQILQQQKQSRLRPAVRVESGVVGKNAYFDQIAATSAVKRTTRHADTPLVNTPHLRRGVSLYDYDWADLVDNMDTSKILTDPTSKYVVNAHNAMNRSMDDEVIAAALATSYGGVDGTTTYPFDSTNCQIAHASAGLTLAKVITAKMKLDAAEVDDEDRYFILGSKQLGDMLATTEVKSKDYNTVQALVNGQIDKFLGFTWIRSERLQVATNVYSCLAFQKNSILLGIGLDVIVDVGPRRDKNMATQVYLGMSIGATRMDQVGVIEVQAYNV